MIYFILCGGIGRRNNQYSLPKPLNYINGKHMIEYVIESIPSDEIYIGYNIYLQSYNFEEIIINLFKTKKIIFSVIDYLTRGPVETAYVAINKININNEPILFIDNDNINIFPNISNINDNFIGYSYDYEKTNYSFIKIENNKIIDIKEKSKISDNYCCGLYGFKNKDIFTSYAKKILYNNLKTKNEFYFSQIYKLMIEDNIYIIPIYIEKTNHIGTYNEIINEKILDKKKLRICFDLDNTLVTYPTVINDYSTVKPIIPNINLLKNLKKNGHEIIIYTARRMKTHGNNVGRVIKDIALTTINTLNDLNIEYDELIFGKPIADIYIDDRAINPYINDISYFGIFNEKETFIHNKLLNNIYNNIIKKEENIIKTGPEKFMKGELYFYQNIPVEIKNYFPNFNKHTKTENTIDISMEYIEGIPLFYLYKNELITKKHLDDLFDILKKINSVIYPINISPENIENNYFKKLENRFNNKKDYYFNDSHEIYQNIIDNLKKYYEPKISNVIHGDFWFSNILIDYNDNYKLIDMKGQVDNILTLNGDKYYDYGKFYQSILGYDLILNNYSINNDYIETTKEYFLKKCIENNLNIDYLKSVTKSLIFGTIHSLNDNKKDIVWNFLKGI